MSKPNTATDIAAAVHQLMDDVICSTDMLGEEDAWLDGLEASARLHALNALNHLSLAENYFVLAGIQEEQDDLIKSRMAELRKRM